MMFMQLKYYCTHIHFNSIFYIYNIVQNKIAEREEEKKLKSEKSQS